jgi:hypothetical protein
MMIVLLLLVVIAGILALPFVLIARRRPAGGATSATEVITYLILVASTLIAASAISALLELVVPGTDVILDGSEGLALSLATLIVSGVVAVAIWIALERKTIGDRARPARDLYLAIVIGVSMGFVAVALVRLGLFTIGTEDFAISAVADLVTFGGLWYLHERLRRQPEELDELRQLAGAFIGLSLSVAGLSVSLNGSLSTIIESARIIAGEQALWEDVRVGFVLTIVGLPFMWWFWFRGLARRPGSWRNGYAAVVSVLGWIAGIISLATALNLGAQWFLGLAEESFAVHFAPLPEALTALLLGGLAYWHHRGVLGKKRNNMVRVVSYIFGGSGLVVGAGAVVTLAAIAIENLVRGDSVLLSDDSRIALGALITLVVGAAAVARYWAPALRLGGDPAEVASPARRTAVLTLLVGFALVGAGALIAVLYVLLRAALEGSTTDLGEELSWAVPLVLVCGAMCWHLAGLRPGKAVPAVAQPTGARTAVIPDVRVGTVTLVASDPGPLPGLVPGMRFLRRSDGVGTVDQTMAEQIVHALAGLSTPAALVTVDTEQFSVIPIA